MGNIHEVYISMHALLIGCGSTESFSRIVAIRHNALVSNHQSRVTLRPRTSNRNAQINIDLSWNR